MPQLTLEEARSLASVLGVMDSKRSVLLILLSKPRSKYDALTSMKELPKSYRVSRASLYRIVDELEKGDFIEVVNVGRMTNRPDEPVNSYGLTLKGLFAAGISAYMLFLDSKTPHTLRDRVRPDELIKALEASAGWPLYLDFLKWHRERGIDLSKAKISMAYFSSMLALSLLEHPESVTEERMRKLAQVVKKLGIAAQIEPKEISVLFRDARDSFREFETKVLEPFLRRTDTKSTAKKEAQN